VPDLAAPFARPVWRREVHPRILAVVAECPALPADMFDLCRLRDLSTLVRDAEGREHLLLSDGIRSIQLDVLEGTLACGAVQLHYQLRGVASLEGPLLSLRRLLALLRTGRFSRELHPPAKRAARLLLFLRAHDAIASGAGHRQIAAEFFSKAANEPRWRSRAPSVRSQVQRLVRGACMMADGGYRSLLH
jgi:hypothetical protein